MSLVGILMGSATDAPLMQPAQDALEELGIPYEVRVLSAHRNPEAVRDYAKGAQERGLEVLIAGAGGAAHLPGVLASWTTLPVIGVPLATTELKGLDSLLSILQMPSGVPVAGVAVNGARNAAFLAAAILALKHEDIMVAYEKIRHPEGW